MSLHARVAADATEGRFADFVTWARYRTISPVKAEGDIIALRGAQ